MKQTKFRNGLHALALISAAAFTCTAWADSPPGGYGQGYGPGYGMGQGMMGGYGQGYGPGYGMGQGMMGGYGQGYGPGYGMGPGMMGGYGQGYGPGYGMGPGMMGGYGQGYGPGIDLKLNAEQRSKITALQNELRRKHWEIMGKMQDEQAKMAELYNADKPDAAALSASNKKLAEMQQQMFEQSLATQKQMDELLTKEQRDMLRRGGRGPAR